MEQDKIFEKAYLVGVSFESAAKIKEDLAELKRLSETADLEVVGETYQVIKEVTPATLLGKGKIEEIAEELEKNGATVVVIDNSLSGSQMKNLSTAFGVKVIDRMGLILDIFAKRAVSYEGKIQVELAQLKYSLPHLVSLQDSNDRFGGGVGMRGPGETKIELNRRKIERRIQKLEKDIEELKEQRSINRQKRLEGTVKRVAIVGYTNVGKSTLLNMITKAGIYADDKLFATLDTTSRKLFLSPQLQVILTDTVGFINKLPHELVEAFASTLEEAAGADLIIHVVDLSNPNYKQQMEMVNKTLNDIGASEIPQIIVYNKVDKLENVNIDLQANEVLISAKSNKGLEQLKEKIQEILDENYLMTK